MASLRCCSCNGSKAKCVRCSCYKSGLPCSSCYPGEKGSCQNSLGSGNNPLSSSPHGLLSPQDSYFSPLTSGAASGATASVQSSLSASSPFPSFCRLPVATSFHVPKSTQQTWSEFLSFALCAVMDCPSDLETWARLFMLPSAFVRKQNYWS